MFPGNSHLPDSQQELTTERHHLPPRARAPFHPYSLPHSPSAFAFTSFCPSQAQACPGGYTSRSLCLDYSSWILAGCSLPIVSQLNGPSTERPSPSPVQSTNLSFTLSHSLVHLPALFSSQPSSLSEMSHLSFFLLIVGLLL